jgi:hypothetical protein
MLYEKLNPEMKKMVDDWAGRLQGYGWRRRGQLLSDVALPFGEDLPPDKAKLAAAGFVTGVLERLDALEPVAEVDDPEQAKLYLISLNPEHRTLAEAYLEEHPEVKTALQGEAEN